MRNSCVAVLKGTLGPQGDLDQLFAVGRHRGAVVAIPGGMDDPEVDLGLDPSWAGSQSVTYGEPNITVCEPLRIW